MEQYTSRISAETNFGRSISPSCCPFPDKIAAVFRSQEVTYRELDEKSNQLAAWLIQQRVQPGTPVGISMSRSIEMLVSILGILKSGSPYVPIDPEYPEEKVRHVIEDANLRIILIDDSTEKKLPLTQITRAFSVQQVLRKTNQIQLHRCFTEPEFIRLGIYNLHFRFHGASEGVAVSHQNLMNAIQSFSREFQLTPEDVVLAVTTISFDISILELLWPLTFGAKIVIMEEGIINKGKASNGHWISLYFTLLVIQLIVTLINYCWTV